MIELLNCGWGWSGDCINMEGVCFEYAFFVLRFCQTLVLKMYHGGITILQFVALTVKNSRVKNFEKTEGKIKCVMKKKKSNSSGCSNEGYIV